VLKIEPDMDQAHLAEALAACGILHQEQFGFPEMVANSGSSARIVCAEFKREDGFHGISFWLHGAGENWYLGLWSGIFFRIQDPQRLADAAADLLSGAVVPGGKPPGCLPSVFLQKYELTPAN
jgi:hypothetical protein